MIPVLLATLAIIDAAFAGFRAAAGRNARVFKRDYYRTSLLRGALAGFALVVWLGALTILLLWLVDDPRQEYAELVRVGARMSWVFVPYAGLVLAALVVYGVADNDLRSFATVAILGPFTLIRPWVIALGCVVGLASGASLPTWVLTIASSGCVIQLGWWLDRKYRARLPAAPPPLLRPSPRQ